MLITKNMDFSKIDLSDNQKLARIIIEEAAKRGFKDRHEFEKFRNSIVKKNKGKIFHNLYFIKAYTDLVEEGKIKSNSNLLNLIQKRTVRTMSGVAPVTVLMKPYPCPGRCIYCPNDVRMPKSYLPSQPAAQRAFRQLFNPYTQVFVRLKALSMTGHEVSKVELRVIGGTFNAYPKIYQKWFVKQCILAMNEFSNQIKNVVGDRMSDFVKPTSVKSSYGTDVVNTVFLNPLRANTSWKKVVKDNETADIRCIGINIETRPDFIDKDAVRRLRELGVTKVEMGVQTTSDKIQKLTGRGHDLEAVRVATRLLKDAGFKVAYHMMPNLPGSTPEFDKKMIAELFENPGYQPDFLKIYPCVVMSKARLSDMYKKGLYKPYDEKTLEEIIEAELRSIPEWCRVDRIARDIPSNEIEGGFKVSNIRQVLEDRFRHDKFACREIRFREIRDEKIDVKNVKLVARKYEASSGGEYFISYEDVKNDKLVALIRLRFPCETFIPELKNSALVRDLHVYGRQIAVGEHGEGEKQHFGWGGKLLKEAEKLSKKAGYKKIAVISGIGTREYYKKTGYILKGSYMIKGLTR